MVTFLNEAPQRRGGARTLAEGLASGFTKGMSQGQEFAQKMALQKQKTDARVQEKAAAKKNLSGTYGSILDTMESMADSVGPFNTHALNPYSEVSGKRAKIGTLRLSLEGLFRDLTLKGQFPKAIYERILNELPNASDTEVKYKQKIGAIRDILAAHEESEGGGGLEQSQAQRGERPPLSAFMKG